MTELWIPPLPLTQPIPRRVRMTGDWKFNIVVISIIFGVLEGFFIGYPLALRNEAILLHSRGREISAEITNKHATFQRGSGYAYSLDYRYAPPELSQSEEPNVWAATSASASDYDELSIGQMLPIVYDPLKPRSSLSKNQIYADQSISTLKPVFLIGLLIVSLYFTTFTIILSLFFKKRYFLRWGKTAAGMVTGEEEYRIKGGSLSRVTYIFKDGRGELAKGQKSGIPTAAYNTPRLIALRGQYLENTTVLFDPKDSSRNTLYPQSSRPGAN